MKKIWIIVGNNIVNLICTFVFGWTVSEYIVLSICQLLAIGLAYGYIVIRHSKSLSEKVSNIIFLCILGISILPMSVILLLNASIEGNALQIAYWAISLFSATAFYKNIFSLRKYKDELKMFGLPFWFAAITLIPVLALIGPAFELKDSGIVLIITTFMKSIFEYLFFTNKILK